MSRSVKEIFFFETGSVKKKRKQRNKKINTVQLAGPKNKNIEIVDCSLSGIHMI